MKKIKAEELKSTRDGFSEGLLKAAEEDPSIVVLTADLKESTRVGAFAEKFPGRFFDVGVAEQALVTIASGMANYGKVPFVTSFSVFSPGRCWEQIRTTICLNDVPVKIIGSHTGFSAGLDGATHQALEDIALMRSLPNMIVITPCDAHEARKAVLEAAKNNKPTYIRLERDPTPLITNEDTTFHIGKVDILWEEKDPQATIIACGPILFEAVKAAKKLKKTGINTTVINCHTIKPLDNQAIIHAAKISGAIVTVEVHQKAGGLGSAVAEILSQNFPVPMEIMGVEDAFGESGKPQELLKKHKLKADDIIQTVKRVIRRKIDK